MLAYVLARMCIARAYSKGVSVSLCMRAAPSCPVNPTVKQRNGSLTVSWEAPVAVFSASTRSCTPTLTGYVLTVYMLPSDTPCDSDHPAEVDGVCVCARMHALCDSACVL